MTVFFGFIAISYFYNILVFSKFVRH